MGTLAKTSLALCAVLLLAPAQARAQSGGDAPRPIGPVDGPAPVDEPDRREPGSRPDPRLEPVLPDDWIELDPEAAPEPGAAPEPERELTPGPAPATGVRRRRPRAPWRPPPRDRIRLGAYMSAFIPSGDLDLAPVPALGARASIRLGGSPVLLGVDYGYATYRFPRRPPQPFSRNEDGARVYIHRFDLLAILELEAVDEVTVHVLGGAGATWFASLELSDQIDPNGVVGVGARYWVRELVSLVIEARLRLIYTRFQQDHNGVSLDFDPRIGVAIHF